MKDAKRARHNKRKKKQQAINQSIKSNQIKPNQTKSNQIKSINQSIKPNKQTNKQASKAKQNQTNIKAKPKSEPNKQTNKQKRAEQTRTKRKKKKTKQTDTQKNTHTKKKQQEKPSDDMGFQTFFLPPPQKNSPVHVPPNGFQPGQCLHAADHLRLEFVDSDSDSFLKNTPEKEGKWMVFVGNQDGFFRDSLGFF